MINNDAEINNLKKLKKKERSAKTKQQKEKLLPDANKIESQIDKKIESTAKQKSLINKSKKLKRLSKQKRDINDARIDLESDSDKSLEKQVKQLKKIGKKISKKPLTKNKTDKIKNDVDTIYENINKKIHQTSINKYIIGKKQRIENLENHQNDLLEFIDTLESQQKEHWKDKSHRRISDGKNKAQGFLRGLGIDKKFDGMSVDNILKLIGEMPVESEKKVNKTKTNSKPVESEKKVNKTKTVNDTKLNNEKIYDYLVQTGNVDSANKIVELMEKSDSKTINKTSDLNVSDDKDVKKLSLVNKGIYKELEQIEKNMTDEQDTSITHTPTVQEKLHEQKNVKNNITSKQSNSFFDSIMSMIGLSSLGFFMKLFKGKKFKVIFDLLRKGDIKGLLKSFGGVKWLIDVIKKTASSLMSKALKPIMIAIDIIKKGIKSFSKLSKLIPGATTATKALSGITSMNTKNPKLNKAVKVSKAAEKGTIKAAEKGTIKAAEKGTIKAAEKGTIKAGEKGTKKAAKKAMKSSASKIAIKGAKKAKTGILKKLLRFAKPIPFLGTALAVGTAVYSAQDGYRHADKIFGIPKKEITETHKIAAAGGAIVDDASFGLIGSTMVAEQILKLATSMGMNSDVTNKIKKEDIPKTLMVNGVEIPLQNSSYSKYNNDKPSKVKSELKFKNDDEKTKKIQSYIDKQKTETVKNDNIGQVLNKDKKMINIENTNSSIINNSIQYNNAKSFNNSSSTAQSAGTNININNTNKQTGNESLFDTFHDY